MDHKYNIGNIVYSAYIEIGSESVECIKCTGSDSIEAQAHDGTSIKIKCPFCYNGIAKHETTKTPRVRKLTIGLIRVEDAYDRKEPKITYMCHETGVHSGTIWYEPDLFLTKEEAIEHLAIEE